MKFDIKQGVFWIAIFIMLIATVGIGYSIITITDTDIQVDGNTIIENVCIATNVDTLVACVATGNKEVKVRAGTYVLTTTLSLPSNITLVGEGASTILTQYGNFHLIANADSGPGNEQIVIRDLVVRGNISQPNGLGIYFINVSDSRIENILIELTAQHGIQLQESNNNIITNIISRNNSQDGITITEGSSYNTLTDSVFYNNGVYGIGLQGTSATQPPPIGNSITNNKVFSNLYGIASKNERYSLINGNTVYNNTYHGLYLGVPPDEFSNFTTVVDNYIFNNNRINSSYDGIYHHGCDSVFTDNTIYDEDSFQRYGININSNCNNVIGTNYIRNVFTAKTLGTFSPEEKVNDILLVKDSPEIKLEADTFSDVLTLSFFKPTSGGAYNYSFRLGEGGVDNGAFGLYRDSASLWMWYVDGTGETYINHIRDDGPGQVVCIKANEALGTCTSTVNSTGGCTCG